MEQPRALGLGILASLLLMAACGGDDAPDGTTIGPGGGTVTSDDGILTLTIPEGALTEETVITIELVPEADWTDTAFVRAFPSFVVGTSALTATAGTVTSTNLCSN